MALTLMHCMQS